MNQPELTISLLGGLIIEYKGTVVTGFASRKAEALFIYLACQPHPQSRETLATLLWPDNDQNRARANLSVVLTSLRKQLDAYLIVERHTVAFNSEADFQLDTALFQQAVAQARRQQQRSGQLGRTGAGQLAMAVALYKGDFLAGFTIRNAPEFEAWVLLEQERLRQQMLDALADLIRFYRQRSQFGEGIRCAQQLLALDPLREETHRQLMQLYLLDDQRPAALTQYNQCVAILAEELGVAPDQATTALYDQIVSGKITGEDTVARLPVRRIPRAPLHNLPVPTTAFIGREAELAQISDWLAQPDNHLLTILGPGGMGKTRLAQEAARAHQGEFANGVWLVSLVSSQNLNEVAAAVAETIGYTLSGREGLHTQLLNHLRSLEMLLVLDNLEHLLSPELRDFISLLTQSAPELRLIVTSRERLHLHAETLLDLYGLPVPAAADSPGAAEAAPTPVAQFAAVALFDNRARRVRAAFDLEAQAAAVVRLCQLVGGLPLALELAAAWTRVLDVNEIVAELQRGLGSLATTLHDVPQRHRSLHAVIESSWRLLAADEQTLLRKLAVFRGGFTAAAAQAVVGGSLPQLMMLVDRSFLRRDEDQRFRRHPLLLQFAQEQLATRPGEKAETEAAHARFFAHLVYTHEAALKESDAPALLAAIGADLENIRVAWQWAMAHMDMAILSQLAGGTGRFFASRGRPLEGGLFFEESLQRVLAQPATDAREALIAQMQVELGYFWEQTGRLPEAEAVLREAEARTRQYQLTATRITCLRVLGVVTDHQGRRDIARRYLEEAHQLCRAQGTPDQLLPILNALGILCVNDAEFEPARAYFEEAMALAESLGNTLRVAVLHGNMAIIANRQKNYPEAIRQWRLAQQGFREHDHEMGLANVIFNIAMALHGLGQYDEALENIQQAYALLEKQGQKHGMAAGLGVMGMIYHKLGKRRAARRHLCDCLLLSQEIGAANIATSGVAELAEMEISGGNLAQAALLLAFILQHPATGGTTRQNAQRLLDELQAELPPQVMAEAAAAVEALTLDSLVRQLVGQPTDGLTG